MRTLLIDGFPTQHDAPPARPSSAGPSSVASARSALIALGHEVETLTLRESDFTSFMTEEERRAYHDEGANLVTDAQRESAELVRSVHAIVVCCPMVAGTVPTMVKSWFERTFVPGVAFTVTESGRLEPGLKNLKRVAMLVECEAAGERTIHGRNGCGKATLRALRLTGNRRCRARYASMKPGSDPAVAIARLLKGWSNATAKTGVRSR